MKKIIIAVLLLLTLTGCNKLTNTPTKKVEAMLNNYVTLNKDVLDDLDNILLSETIMTNEQKEKYKKILKRQYQNMSYEIKNETPKNENDNFKLDESNFSLSFTENSDILNINKAQLKNNEINKNENVDNFKENIKDYENNIISNELVIPENDICLSFVCTPKKFEKEISTDSQSSNNKTVIIKEINIIDNDIVNSNDKNKNIDYQIIKNNKANNQNIINSCNEDQDKKIGSDKKKSFNKNKRKKNFQRDKMSSTQIMNNQKLKLSPIYFYSYPMIQNYNNYNSNNDSNLNQNYLINNDKIFFNQNNINNDIINYNNNYNYFNTNKTKTEKFSKKKKLANNNFINGKENTCILEINFKVSEKKMYKFKLRRFDNMFKEVLNFCTINNLDKKHANNIIYLIIKSLNSIYSIYNLELTKDEIKEIKGMKKYYDSNFL